MMQQKGTGDSTKGPHSPTKQRMLAAAQVAYTPQTGPGLSLCR